jgi:PadR family transcriptional regulator, regulatory protein PadR
LSANHNKIETRPRNWLMAMALLILREKSSYGYQLMDRLREEEFGFEQLNPGTMYRTLRHMEEEGLCESEWRTSECGPARRMYSLTQAGEAYLSICAQRCEKYQRVVESFFVSYAAK